VVEREDKEFCPHGGMHDPGAESPATLAGRADGKMLARLRVAALAAASLWGLYALHASLGGTLDALVGTTAALVGVASLGLIALTSMRKPSIAVPVYAMIYMLGSAFAVALVEQHYGMRAGLAGGISWAAIWVAFFPLTIPCSPRHTLIKALMAASMTPLVFAGYALAGRPLPPAMDVVALFVPVFVGAFVAYGGARVLERLGGQMEAMASIGRYELQQLLGEGGMGEVWRAKHRMLARPVALKVVKRGENHEADSRGKARFLREAKVTASLESAHTVELYDFGTTEDGRFYYVMELLDGLDLEELVKRHGPLPAHRVVHILKQALRSLEEAHARGLVHRDVKPANLHLGRYALAHDHLKVLDFGLARQSFDVELGLTVTGDGKISGTPAYMAPEAIEGHDVDGRADIYALGCVAIYLLTGERVFEEPETVLAAAVAHVTERPLTPTERGVVIDDALEGILMSTLEKDPVRRPDARSLREMLERADVAPWTEDDAAQWWAMNAPFAEKRISDAPPRMATAPTMPGPVVLRPAM